MRHPWKARLVRCCAAALCWTLCAPCFARAEEATAPPYPEELRISIRTETRQTADGADTEVDFPVTCNDEVNRRLDASVEALWQEALAHAQAGDVVEMTATYRVSGTSWAGFLLMGRVIRLGESDNRSYVTQDTVYLGYDVQSYDMATGAALTLADVFPQDSPAWQSVCKLAEEALRGYYPDQARDEQAVAALCGETALRAMPFLPCAGRLMLTLPLESTLPEHRQLVQASLPYPDFCAQMTEAAAAQTDNSARPIIAITYDDGPMHKYTQLVLRNLARYGASATFFCIGESVQMWPDIVRRELDYGHTVGSHTMEHRYAWKVDSKYMRQDRVDCLTIFGELLGKEPWLFRAPGGGYEKYINHQIGWPLIQWGSSAGDTGNNKVKALAAHVVANAQNGRIVLMHDIYAKTAEGTALFLQELTDQGYMFATVDELMYLHGVTPQPDTVYADAFGPAE